MSLLKEKVLWICGQRSSIIVDNYTFKKEGFFYHFTIRTQHVRVKRMKEAQYVVFYEILVLIALKDNSVFWGYISCEIVVIMECALDICNLLLNDTFFEG